MLNANETVASEMKLEPLLLL